MSRPTPREMPEMTPAERRANWWHYHWMHLVLAGVAIALLVSVVSEQLARVEPDCTVAVVTRRMLTAEEELALRTALEPLAADTNGDGRVSMALSTMAIDFTSDRVDEVSAQMMAGSLEKLNADFFAGQSGLFLLDDPASFVEAYHALRYLDGSEPAEEAADWQAMVHRLADSPALQGLEAELPELPLDTLWIGRRVGGPGTDFAGAEALWLGLFPEGAAG